jgi:hypothetical protein
MTDEQHEKVFLEMGNVYVQEAALRSKAIGEFTCSTIRMQLRRAVDSAFSDLELFLSGKAPQKSYITTYRCNPVAVPKDWWQHFKQRWFPGWALRRWPVQYRIIEREYRKTIVKMCPHFDTRFQGDRRHVEFCLLEDAK